MLQQIYQGFGVRKGLNGKVAVIGGSFEYTGAPYYAAAASLKAVNFIQGADLAHVFCQRDAGIPIKSYSPELIVHPVIQNNQQSAESILNWQHAITSFIIGPGLGRDSFVFDTVLPNIFEQNDFQQKPVIIDADGLNFLVNYKIQPFQNCILTPNLVEFSRLWNAFFDEQIPDLNNFHSDLDRSQDLVSQLATHLNCTIVVKGQYDIISDGQNCITISTESGQKRVGGQGDILAGVLSVISHLSQIHQLNTVQAAGEACKVTREASRLSGIDHPWSVTAPDILLKLPEALHTLLKTI